MKTTALLAILLGIAMMGIYHASSATNLPVVGSAAPDFSLPDASGKLRSLKSFKGKWLILYFYPKDDTPGCTKEACSFRDDITGIEKLGGQVVGVSVDSGESHANFAKKYRLPFPLLSDQDGLVAEKYGAITNLGFVKFAKRYTFLINPEGNISKIYLRVDSESHSQEIIDDLTKLVTVNPK